MDSQAANKPLRFGCPACGVRLVVDQSIAGTEGPCPSCGARIVAPPVDVTHSLVEKQAAPVAIKPRAASGKSRGATVAMAGQAQIPDQRIESEPMTRPQGRGRAVSPNTILSEEHAEKQNMKVFIKIMIAVLIVAVIAVATYFILMHAS